ncbi:hypothetical protein ACQBAU_04020 [Propionibacteriaceae bacterium Y2011]
MRLLGLTDDWALTNGAGAALAAAPRSTCRRWARAIHAAWPDLDGLWVNSTFTNRANVVLWRHAEFAFPDAPAFSEQLDQEQLWGILTTITARYLSYRLI